ncbi:MAG TPA: HD domain-containing protein [Solirubrobacteraceae bacterium]|jgi:(p)ppGpp synthase/HD superfamily hydrolase|nr:HD domain-containing protein [Solirubrobacteraceae bacterium]
MSGEPDLEQLRAAAHEVRELSGRGTLAEFLAADELPARVPPAVVRELADVWLRHQDELSAQAADALYLLVRHPREPALGPRFAAALAFAAQAHAEQVRKGSGLPYLGHLLGVCALVIGDGGGEDEAIAALLHDAVEDQGGEEMLERIRERFGADVARIVLGCSDTLQTPKPPWRERKEAYLAHLQDADGSILRVSLADKLDNARSIARDLGVYGETVWRRFGAPREEQLWYYRALSALFLVRTPGPLADELAVAVAAL